MYWKMFSNKKLSSTLALLITSGIVFFFGSAEGAVRNVNLTIEPAIARRGSTIIVRCTYELADADLYAVKFYRGQFEFYRFTPGQYPNSKIFPFPGINVDLSTSNGTQVVVRNVGFGLTGNFSCEVSADAPYFSTGTAIGVLHVVELPDKRPLLTTDQPKYELGDILQANCSSPPSRPRTELTLTINNMVITDAETQYIRTIDSLIATRITLSTQLTSMHFSSMNPYNYHMGYGGYMSNSVYEPNGRGSLVLRCTAQIGDLYQEYSEKELSGNQKDPIPARVTLSSRSIMGDFFNSLFSSSAANNKSLASSHMLIILGILVSLFSTFFTSFAIPTPMFLIESLSYCRTGFKYKGIKYIQTLNPAKSQPNLI